MTPIKILYTTTQLLRYHHLIIHTLKLSSYNYLKANMVSKCLIIKTSSYVRIITMLYQYTDGHGISVYQWI